MWLSHLRLNVRPVILLSIDRCLLCLGRGRGASRGLLHQRWQWLLLWRWGERRLLARGDDLWGRGTRGWDRRGCCWWHTLVAVHGTIRVQIRLPWKQIQGNVGPWPVLTFLQKQLGPFWPQLFITPLKLMRFCDLYESFHSNAYQGVQPWALTKFPDFSLTFPWPFCGFPWPWDILSAFH